MSTYVEQPIVDPRALRSRVREMYRAVAREPGGDFHFETGRALAERLGYPAGWLDAVPPDALASFAGVGHMLDLAAIEPGRRNGLSTKRQESQAAITEAMIAIRACTADRPPSPRYFRATMIGQCHRYSE